MITSTVFETYVQCACLFAEMRFTMHVASLQDIAIKYSRCDREIVPAIEMHHLIIVTAIEMHRLIITVIVHPLVF